MKFFVLLGAALLLAAGAALADNSNETSSVESQEVSCPTEPCKGQYEEWRCCGKCQEVCFQKQLKCTTKCTKGCYCLEGFVRQYADGKCIPKKLCHHYWSRAFSSGGKR
ncbi:trypsin inhibitor [Anopheles gambiae]|uniref:TIL domain-containing protein n=1 Tax=Anopheles coluzzii TaxID=1518534 RepID=A0A6E8VBT7_ANOCL|nr:trypsin inhibitor [Anopheles gambiae]XP_040223698.1 trypsin inhibitor-like [Anopheles coluzzii]